MGLEPIGLLSDYRLTITVPVWWGDQDAFGHVNNTVYLRWFESARIAHGLQIGLSDLMETERIGPILASIECHFRYPLTFPDTVHVGARITRLGRTSMTMEHRVVSASAGRVAAEGTSTIVVYDYNRAVPHAIPDELRARIRQLEGRALG